MFNDLTAVIANAHDGDFVYIPELDDRRVDAQLAEVTEALDYMREELLVRGRPELAIPEVRQALGTADASNFK